MAENQPLLASDGEPLSAPPPTYTEVDLNKSNGEHNKERCFYVIQILSWATKCWKAFGCPVELES